MLVDVKSSLTPTAYPRFNEHFAMHNSINTQPKSYREISDWIDRTPEAVSIISAIVTDILGEDFDWIGSASKVKKAVKWSS